MVTSTLALGPTRAMSVYNRFVAAAGHQASGESTLGDVLGRQLIFGFDRTATGSPAIQAVSSAAKDLDGDPSRLVSFLEGVAAYVDGGNGARLRGVILTDSREGFSLADALATVDERYGVEKLSEHGLARVAAEKVADVRRWEGSSPSLAHGPSNTMHATVDDHEGWIVVGPKHSADIRFVAGLSPQHSGTLSAEEIASVTGASPADVVGQEAAYLLGHEGGHLRQKRLGLRTPTELHWLNEASAEASVALDNQGTKLARRFGVDSAHAHLASKITPFKTAKSVRSALLKLLEHAGFDLNTDSGQRLAFEFISQTPTQGLPDALAALIGPRLGIPLREQSRLSASIVAAGRHGADPVKAVEAIVQPGAVTAGGSHPATRGLSASSKRPERYDRPVRAGGSTRPTQSLAPEISSLVMARVAPVEQKLSALVKRAATDMRATTSASDLIEVEFRHRRQLIEAEFDARRIVINGPQDQASDAQLDEISHIVESARFTIAELAYDLRVARAGS